MKISNSLKGNIPWNKGLKGFKPEHNGRFKEGFIPWNKGKPWSQEIKDKLSLAHRGHKNGKAWKGGISGLTERVRISMPYRQWRSDVFRRDGWTCQTCGLRGHGRDIEAHHIKPLKEFFKIIPIDGLTIDEKYNLAMNLEGIFDVSNGITLCKQCHILTYKKETKMNRSNFILVAVLLSIMTVTSNAQAWFVADPKTTEGAANVSIPVFNNSSSVISAGNNVGLDADASTNDNDFWVALVDAVDTGVVIGVVWPADIAAGSAGSVVVYGFAECDIDGAGVDENGLICSSNSGSGGLGKTCANNDQAYAIANVDNAGSTQTSCFVINR